MNPESHPRRKSLIVKTPMFCMKGILLLCGALVLAQTAAAQNGAEVVSVEAPAFVEPDASFTATITMRNTGTTVWETFTRYALGSEGPRDNNTWLAGGRVALPDEAFVAPGETFAFTTTDGI